MKPALFKAALLFSLVLVFSACSHSGGSQQDEHSGDLVRVGQLPPALTDGEISFEQAIFNRSSVRRFSEQQLSLQQAGQLLWAAQGLSVDGISSSTRTAPSAGATHPMEIYLAAGSVEGLDPGLYRYDYLNHGLEMLLPQDIRDDLARAALNQSFIADAPVSIILAAEYERTTSRYGDRGVRYVHMEVGHITQNILLQAEALNLGALAVGAFNDQEVKTLLNIAEEPLMIIPAGEAATGSQ